MESHQLTITAAARSHGDLSLRPCGADFFPASADGSVELRLHVAGLSECVTTSLATGRDNKPRWRFRSRQWFRRFADAHGLAVGDRVVITRLASADYRVSPVLDGARFIDLFAGIGGMRLAFEAAGAQCVFSSEWDKYSQKTYEHNFGERPAGDITQIPVGEIPDHDILVGGFPCQPFSIAGVSKKNALGQAHGFKCQTQGTLFFDVARIIEEKQPRAFLLENVKNLQTHDRGRTFRVIRETLEEELGYDLSYAVIDARTVVPQHRERIFLVGTRDGLDFSFPDEEELASFRQTSTLGEILLSRVPPKYTLTDHLWNYLQRYAEKHRAAGNGFGFGLVGRNDTTRTLSARYYKDGSEILVRQPRRNPRRLTPRECARLMGFPDAFEIVVSDTQAYRQFGNSVCVPVVQAIAERLVNVLRLDGGVQPASVEGRTRVAVNT